MDRHEPADDVLDPDRSDEEPVARRRSPHPTWVRFVAAGVILLFVLATLASALF